MQWVWGNRLTRNLPNAYNPFVKGIYCQECGQKRREMVCPHCGHVYVYIRFEYQGEKFALYHDKHGKAYTYSAAELDKRQIDDQRANDFFRPEEWRTTEKDAKKFINLFSTFLDQ